MTTPRLIVFEGVDAAGKSSICAKLAESLKTNGTKATLLSFPGAVSGTLGELVYRIHHGPENFGIQQMTELSVQALHIASHLDAIERTILPLLNSGGTVILDRYWWSTWAYGIANGANRDVLETLIAAERIAWKEWKPSALFYISRTEPLRAEPRDKWTLYKSAYQELLARERGQYPIYEIKNEMSLENSISEVLNACGLT